MDNNVGSLTMGKEKRRACEDLCKITEVWSYWGLKTTIIGTT